ncbi:MAG TPA: hypothetical protein VLH77_00290 [Gammaproteobacteria bacterium]|nr:hypothetical protein [Gammaproteobacteria bacterium]
MNNPIDAKILEINEKDPILRAELILNALYPYAKEFLNLWHEMMNMKDVYQYDLEKFIKALWSHPFSVSLSTQDAFKEAKEKMVAQKWIFFGEEAKKTFGNMCNFFTLEFMLADFVASYMNPESFQNLKAQMVMKKEPQKQVRKKLLEARQALLTSGGMIFRPSSKQYLLAVLLEDIKNDESVSLYNYGRSDKFWLRHLMTKELMKLMFEKYGAADLDPWIVADIVLTVTKVFYQPMDKSDASELAGHISLDRIKDKEFRQKRVAELIGMT